MDVHPTAIVDAKAGLARGVIIGPYSVIGSGVTIGPDTMIGPHVVIEGNTRIGARNNISQFVSIGSPPQDVGYQGEDTRVVIGDDNIIREYATVNRATTKQEWTTVVGNGNYVMAYAHIAHDCILGDGIILSNASTLGGHITVGDHATVGALSAVHQFTRIGTHAFIGGMTGIPRDAPPFMLAAGPRATLYGPNQKGLVRFGISNEAINGLKKAFRIIWRKNKVFSKGINQVKEEIEPFPELVQLIDFIEASERGVLR